MQMSVMIEKDRNSPAINVEPGRSYTQQEEAATEST